MKNTMLKVVTASARRFGKTKNEIEREKKKKRNTERSRFAQTCPAYGLSPDFYLEGALSDTSEYFELVGLNGAYATLRSMDDTEVLVPFQEAMDMVLKNLRHMNEDLPKRADLLKKFEDDDVSPESTEEVKNEIQKRIFCVKKSIGVWNGNMEEISASMGVPMYAGWIDREGTNLYEFVSFREEKKDGPYILENLDCPADDPDRFKEVSFSSLIKGLKRLADMNGDIRLMSSLQNAVPITGQDANDAGLKQQSLFDYM